ncbi:MAG: transcription termination factor NusA [Planctomycetaceae bacterium]|jgi:N utilization substance protein A|nr:transcription termination factor NusA [Planctomycetaceae bacterium]
MNPSEVLRIVDAIHRDKRIDKEIVFVGIEAAIATAARKQYGEDTTIKIHVDRETGEISGTQNGEPLSPEEMSERIGAQSAKQVMIQKIREAERDAIFEENRAQIDQMVVGIVQRIESGKGKKDDGFREGGAITVSLHGVEAVLPRGERIPGEVFHPGDRVRGIVIEVKKTGNRVKVILSRIRPIFVQKLFEQEIPEIQEAVIEIKSIAREPGYRTKMAVYSSDQRIDCVGACIGMRGSRIKNITEELNDERIDVVPWSSDMQVFIPNALRPAEIEEVILCSMLGRAVVLVRQDQRSLAIGRKGQNVRLASKLCGWDVEIMTREELEADIEKAIEGYSLIQGIDPELADRLVGEGFLTFDDLSIIEPNDLAQMGNISMEEAEAIIEQAEQFAEQEEKIKANQSNREQIKTENEEIVSEMETDE